VGAPPLFGGELGQSAKPPIHPMIPPRPAEVDFELVKVELGLVDGGVVGVGFVEVGLPGLGLS
jgi:hypothetical protein